ncbi:MAG: flagellar type III secretion system pore protein FliP [Myxococcales bacterium]|nr:flagellar type III secretion system pore protein FliP [Myxococcales bacterium]
MLAAIVAAGVLIPSPSAWAQPLPLVAQQGWTGPLKVLGLLTLLSLVPALVLTTTSFTRVVVVLGFVRSGIGTPQTPPTQVIVGLSLFLSFFTMAPVLSQIYDRAYAPYAAGQIDEAQALERATVPLRSFMLRQTREADLVLFYDLAQKPLPKTEEEVPIHIAIPAFVVSELTTAFQMGALVLLPFLLVDIAVSATLMAMGMMMVPPSSISLPLKLLLFVVVDGWHLLAGSLVRSFA